MTLRLSEIPGIDRRLVDRLRILGYDELWPSQEKAAPIAVAGGNVMLAVPTASGKSLVAYLAILSRLLKGGKALYIVPLRALAAEKFEDLRELCAPLGLRASLSIGDLDDADPGLGKFDVIIATSEKADALMRHRAKFIEDLSCVVADEVHLLGDADRGPTLEVLLTRIKQRNPRAQLVALSATIANSKQVAKWLGAAHVETTWRPVTLREGVHWGAAVHYTDNTKERVASDLDDPTLALTEDSVRAGGQVLVFVNTRKSTEALAEKLASATKGSLSAESRAALAAAAAEIKTAEGATSVEARLARAISGGAAFHHAGLTNTHRAMVERLFKQGHLKALSATPTLAAGINLPARRVIVRDLWRFADDGQQPIPVLEYKQMAGRAGRPKYDKVGEAITLAKAEDQRAEIVENYLLAPPEKMDSQLGRENVLRAHILSSVATGFVRDEAELKEFWRHTFFAEEFDLWRLEEESTRVIDFLLENELLSQSGDAFKATKFGKRVSELYIDPLSAVELKKALAAAGARDITPFGWLHVVAHTPDVRPLFARRTDGWLEAEAVERRSQFVTPPPEGRFGMEDEFFLNELKTALLFEDWIAERSEEDLVKKYGAYPGDVFQKVEAADWILHAGAEIARLFAPARSRELKELATRTRYGAKAELLPLLKFRGIGRYRARQLWGANFKSGLDLAAAAQADIARVVGIGPALAASLKRQAGGDDDPGSDALRPSEPSAEPPKAQRSLADFGSGP
ncbi:MAG: DEAD/DEAH box helicase [Thermoplasmatota archaeon]